MTNGDVQLDLVEMAWRKRTEEHEANVAQADRHSATLRTNLLELVGSEALDDHEDTDLAPFHQFLTDLDESLGPLHVAGIAYPDAELPEELARLSRRAEELGLSGANGHLARLALHLGLVSQATQRSHRENAASLVWNELQHLLTWLRLLRVEYGLLAARRTLLRGVEGTIQLGTPGAETMSLQLSPVGLSLAGDALLIYAQDEAGMRVVIRDTLAELDPNDPIRGTAISRFFQDNVCLWDVMRATIVLRDHPYGGDPERDPFLMFEPHFRAVPQLRDGRDQRPALPDLMVDEQGELIDEDSSLPLPDGRWGRIIADLSRRDRRIELHALGMRKIPVSVPSVLQFVGTKWLLAEGRDRIRCRPVLMRLGSELRLLTVQHDMEGTILPAWDPMACRMAPEVLARRCDAVASELDSALLAGHLRTAVYRLGGDREHLAVVREHLQQLPAKGLAQTWRRALGLYLAGGDPVDADTFDLVAAALRLANVEGDYEPADVALVYNGEEITDPVLDSEQTYQAMWLATVLPYSDELQDDLSAMFASRYAGELVDPTVEDVCARAMAIALMGFAGALDASLDDDEDEIAGVDELVDPDGEDGDEPGGFEGIAEAVTFLRAHQDDLLKRKSLNQLGQPLRRIYRLADTMAWLNGVERRDLLPVAHTIDRIWLAQQCADALVVLLGPPPDDVSPKAAANGIDALTLLVSAGLYPYFLD